MAESSLAASDAPSASEIRAELERILGSADFNVPERAHAFLEYVVTETLAGRADRIKAYSIAVEVFGRGASFDPQSDPIVRIEAGRVRRALERYYLTAGASDPIVFTIPKGSYVPAFSRQTLQKATASAEPTPEPSDVKRFHTRSVVLPAVVILVIVAAWAAAQWFTPPHSEEGSSSVVDSHGPNLPKLLVEPFQDLSGTTEGATIATGLTEELVGKLTSYKELVVVVSDPRRPDSETLAEETKSTLRYALTGSVRIEGDAIRLSIRLIDRSNGSVLWANNYDGSHRVGRLLEMESDVAGDIARVLGQPYGVVFQADATRAPQGPPEEWEAYACTLAYYSYRRVLDPSTHASVKQCLERAVQRFPSYATAWALLSLMYIDELRFGYHIDPTASLTQAIDAARRAVALDPTNARAMQAQLLSLFFKDEVDEALKVGERATALNPNDTELVGEYGMRLALSGEWARGCQLIEQSAERNPAPLGFYDVALAVCFYMQGDYQKAESWVRKANVEKNPLYHFVAAAIYGQLGDAAAAGRERQWILTNASQLVDDIHRELKMRIKVPRDQEHFLEGLKRAGLVLPES